jgi:hypothetical protein
MDTQTTPSPEEGYVPTHDLSQMFKVTPHTNQSAFEARYGKAALDLLDESIYIGNVSSLIGYAALLLHHFEMMYFSRTKVPVLGARIFGWDHDRNQSSEADLQYVIPLEVAPGVFQMSDLYGILQDETLKIRRQTVRSDELAAMQETFLRLTDILSSFGTRHVSDRFDVETFRFAFNSLLQERLQQDWKSYRTYKKVKALKEAQFYEDLPTPSKDLVNLFTHYVAIGGDVSSRLIHQLTGQPFAQISRRVQDLVNLGFLSRQNTSYSSVTPAFEHVTPAMAKAYVQANLSGESDGGEVEAQSRLILAVLNDLGASEAAVPVRQSEFVVSAFRGIYSDTSGALVDLPLRRLEKEGLVTVARDVRPYQYQILGAPALTALFEDVSEDARPLLRQVLTREGSCSMPEPSWLLEQASILDTEEVVTTKRASSAAPNVSNTPNSLPLDDTSAKWAEVAMGVSGPKAMRRRKPSEFNKSLSTTASEGTTAHNLQVSREVDPALAALIQQTTQEGLISMQVSADGTRTVTYTFSPDEVS